MPTFNILKKNEIKETFRTKKLKDMFDLKDEHSNITIKGEIPIENIDWSIGLIYGNSGTGKSTILKEVFNIYDEKLQYKEESFLDDFDKKISFSEIITVLNQCGFSSPPNFLRPYAVLSNGEKMRVDLARKILSKKEIIIFDEFTSVVDRIVARTMCVALNKTIKKMNKKIILVSCHDDIIDYLDLDWIFNTNDMIFTNTRGLPHRGQLKFEVYKNRGHWGMFSKYHYLNHDLHKSSDQYILTLEKKLVGFCAVRHFPHSKNKKIKKVTRLVILPDFQGIGLGLKLLNEIAKLYKNYDFTISTIQPALINSLIKNKYWSCFYCSKRKAKDNRLEHLNKNRITKTNLFSFIFIRQGGE